MSKQQADKVNWIREQQFTNGTKVSISEKSGVVKIDVEGTGRRAPMLYRDEILALLACTIELQNYLEANQDKAFTKEAKRAADGDRNHLSRAAGNVSMAKAQLVGTLVANGKTPDEIAAILKVSGF